MSSSDLPSGGVGERLGFGKDGPVFHEKVSPVNSLSHLGGSPPGSGLHQASIRTLVGGFVPPGAG